jgi:hypothetical protein
MMEAVHTFETSAYFNQTADIFIIASMRTGNVKPSDVLSTHDLDNGGSRRLRLDIPENCHLQYSFFIDSFF